MVLPQIGPCVGLGDWVGFGYGIRLGHGEVDSRVRGKDWCSTGRVEQGYEIGGIVGTVLR